MMRYLKAEFLKCRRRHLALTVGAMLLLVCAWAFYGEYRGSANDFLMKNGYMLFLYQLSLIHMIFFPLLSSIVAVRLWDVEYKGSCLKQLCAVGDRRRLYDAKLICGLSFVLGGVVLFWLALLIFFQWVGFGGGFPLLLYLRHLLCMLLATAAIYLLQHTLSMVFQNQAVPFFIGLIGEFAGLFLMYFPQGIAQRFLVWSYYGVLQFVGLYGWTKEAHYAHAYFEVSPVSWPDLFLLVGIMSLIYFVGKVIFQKKEVS